MFIIGLSYKAYQLKKDSPDFTNFDYSSQDELFRKSGIKNSKVTESAGDTNIDYKREVLDFKDGSFSKKEPKKLPELKSININIAGLKDLVRLPGLGNKTAEKIISLREKKGGFKKLNELLEVKGIGDKKLNNIEKFLYIDH